jgi:hypothetical protein
MRNWPGRTAPFCRQILQDLPTIATIQPKEWLSQLVDRDSSLL